MRFTAKPKNGSFKKISFKKLLAFYFVFIYLALFIVMDLPRLYLNRNRATQTDNNALLEDTLGLKAYNFREKPAIAEDNDLTAVLIVGIDTRNAIVKDGEFYSQNPSSDNSVYTRNTDTIMQAVYDHRTGNILMISIPRDMGIDVRKDCLKYSGAINQVYVKGQRSSCEESGIELLQEVVESVTGIKSQYYVMVSLNAFEEVIKIVGETNSKGEKGIFVNNPKDVWDVYPIATGWENVYFPKGKLFLNPYRALQYARTRQYTSDFDRAGRQQLIVEAVIDRVLSTDTLLNPSKINELLTSFDSLLVYSKPQNFTEILQILDVARQIDKERIYHIVLDPEFGGHEVYLNKAPHDRRGPYYMVPTAWKDCPGNEFCKVQDRISEILINPDLIE